MAKTPVRQRAPAAPRARPLGLARVEQIWRRTTWLKAGIAAAVVLAVLIGVAQFRHGGGRRTAEFDSWFAQGSALLASGDHAGAVERFRKAIDAMPDQE